MASLTPSSPEAAAAASAAQTQLSSDPGARQGLRDALFRESFPEICQRVALGLVWSLHPKRIRMLRPLPRLWVSQLAEPDVPLPDPSRDHADGEIVGITQGLSVPILLEAYGRGLFPHSHVGLPKWLSPPERCVLFLDNFHMSKRLRRLMRQGRYTVTFDKDFEEVIKACAGKREGRWRLTWITPRIMHAYAALFDAGHVHSFEVWNSNGELVGGGYGLALGRVFFTESQFSHEPNTSKLGFSVLNWHLAKWGYAINDGKWSTPTILDMGFKLIPREAFLGLLANDATSGGKPGRWSVEAGPEFVADWHGNNSSKGADEGSD